MKTFEEWYSKGHKEQEYYNYISLEEIAEAYAKYCVEQEAIVWKKTIERLEKTIDFNVKTNIDLMKKLNGTPKPTEQ